MSVRLKSGVLFAVCGIVLAVLAAAAAVLLYRRSAGSSVKAEADTLLSLNGDRRGLTGLQIQTFLPDLTPEYERKLTELKSARAAGEWKMTAAAVPKLRLFLQQTAEKLIPALPEAAGKAEGFAAVSAMRGYLSSPLAAYLDPATVSKLKAELAEQEENLYRDWRGLRCDRVCDIFPQCSPKLVFVPPGAAKSPGNGKTVKIPYPFWIGQTEVTVPPRPEPSAAEIGPSGCPGDPSPLERYFVLLRGTDASGQRIRSAAAGLYHPAADRSGMGICCGQRVAGSGQRPAGGARADGGKFRTPPLTAGEPEARTSRRV